jgi:hypothetical protein
VPPELKGGKLGFPPVSGAGDESRTRDLNLGKASGTSCNTSHRGNRGEYYPNRGALCCGVLVGVLLAKPDELAQHATAFRREMHRRAPLSAPGGASLRPLARSQPGVA